MCQSVLVFQCRLLQWAHLNVQLVDLAFCLKTVMQVNVVLTQRSGYCWIKFQIKSKYTVNFIWTLSTFVRCISTYCVTCCCRTRRLTQKSQPQMSDPRIHHCMFWFSDSLCLNSPPHLAVHSLRPGDKDNTEKKSQDKLLRHWLLFCTSFFIGFSSFATFQC